MLVPLSPLHSNIHIMKEEGIMSRFTTFYGPWPQWGPLSLLFLSDYVPPGLSRFPKTLIWSSRSRRGMMDPGAEWSCPSTLLSASAALGFSVLSHKHTHTHTQKQSGGKIVRLPAERVCIWSPKMDSLTCRYPWGRCSTCSLISCIWKEFLGWKQWKLKWLQEGQDSLARCWTTA